MAKPMPPEMKQELLANIIETACRDFRVPEEHVGAFTHGVTESVRRFEPSPPETMDELRALQQVYRDAKDEIRQPLKQELLGIYAGITANYYLATIAGLDDPQKYAGCLPPEEVVRKLLGAGKDELS